MSNTGKNTIWERVFTEKTAYFLIVVGFVVNVLFSAFGNEI